MPRRQNGKKDLIKFFLETQILFPPPKHITRSPCVWASVLPWKQSVCLSYHFFSIGLFVFHWLGDTWVRSGHARCRPTVWGSCLTRAGWWRQREGRIQLSYSRATPPEQLPSSPWEMTTEKYFSLTSSFPIVPTAFPSSELWKLTW